MASRTALRFVLLAEPWQPVCLNQTFVRASLRTGGSFCSTPRLSGKSRDPKARGFHAAKRTQLDCSHNESPSSSQDDQGPPQEAVLKAISEVSKTEGRVGQTTNVVIGGTVADDSTNEWLALDQKVNSYPTVRGFTAIGTGGDDFVQAMVVAVESVIQQPIPEGRVRQKVSSRGKYVSVNIGPIQVISSEQVQAVYNAMRRDERMKYFL
ncbi:hypothetical protein F2P56_036106 [Juglans regia]|uniref:Uncharacterized protein LOC108981488 n=2 Tax=Juglans regia TaxID=51240 RepID=A0A2I4DM52_JUGRE|nr:uncharacterized protein LOC108981488 [Juglans regia]KAF5443559.1 hypothetical protein F2P56_036106 [Juglans regia]